MQYTLVILRIIQYYTKHAVYFSYIKNHSKLQNMQYTLVILRIIKYYTKHAVYFSYIKNH